MPCRSTPKARSHSIARICSTGRHDHARASRPTTRSTEFADKITDKSKELYGLCLRGKPGWGENMAFIDPMVNTFGGRWFDMDWKPQLTTEPWKKAINWYVET